MLVVKKYICPSFSAQPRLCWVHQFVLQWSLFTNRILAELTMTHAETVKEFRLLFGWMEAILGFHEEQLPECAEKCRSRAPSPAEPAPQPRVSNEVDSELVYLRGKVASLENRLRMVDQSFSTATHPTSGFPTPALVRAPSFPHPVRMMPHNSHGVGQTKDVAWTKDGIAFTKLGERMTVGVPISALTPYANCNTQILSRRRPAHRARAGTFPSPSSMGTLPTPVDPSAFSTAGHSSWN